LVRQNQSINTSRPGGFQFAQHCLIAGYSFRKTGNPLIQGSCLLTCLPFFCLLYDGLDAKNTVCCGKMPNDHGNIADHCQIFEENLFYSTYLSYFFQNMKPEPHIFCNVQN
jgi:hypothetical protein